MTIKHSLSSLLSILLIIGLIAPSLLPLTVEAQSNSSADRDYGEADVETGRMSEQADAREAAEEAGQEAASEADNAAAEGRSAAEAAARGDAAGAREHAAAAQGASDRANAASGRANAAAGVADTDDARSTATQATDAATYAAGQATVAGAIADAAARGIANTAMDMDASLDCGCVMGRTTGEYSTENGIADAVDRMADAEINSAGSSNAVNVSGTWGNFQSRTSAPTNNVNTALETAMRSIQTNPIANTQLSSRMMNPTPLSRQVEPITTANTVDISSRPVTGVTPTQSFSTANPAVNATSFSLGTFTPGLSTEPATESWDPNSLESLADQYAEYGRGRAVAELSVQRSALQNQLAAQNDDLNETISIEYGDVTTQRNNVTPAERAALEATQAALDAVNARISAVMNPTEYTQEVASVLEDRASQLQNGLTNTGTMSVNDQYAQAALGTAVGRLASIEAGLQNQLSQMPTPSIDFLSNNPTTDVTQAERARVEAQIDALAARRNAMTDSSITNRAVAALQEERAAAIGALADQVASQTAQGQTAMAAASQQTLDTVRNEYAARIDAVQNDPALALNEVARQNLDARRDLATSLGYATDAFDDIDSFNTTPSAVETGLNALGIDPQVAATIGSYTAPVENFIGMIVDPAAFPGIASAIATAAAIQARAIATEIDAPAQEVVAALTAAGVADPYGMLTEVERQSISMAPAYDAYANALTERIGTQVAIDVATVAAAFAAPHAIAGIRNAATSLRSLMNPVDDFVTPSLATVTSQPTGVAVPGSRSVSPVSTVNNTTPTPNLTGPRVSYDPVRNVVTVIDQAPPAVNVVEGRIARTAANDNLSATPSTVASPANTTVAGYRSATQNPASRAVANDNVPTTVTTQNPASQAVANNNAMTAPASLADNVTAPVSTVDNSVVSGVTRRNDSLLGQPQTTPSSNAPQRVTSAVMAVVEMLSTNPASMARSYANILDNLNIPAISRRADDIATTPAPTTINNAARTTQTPTGATAPVATAQPVGLTPASVPAVTVPGILDLVAPSETAVPGATTPAATAPTTQAPAVQVETPTTQVIATEPAATTPAPATSQPRSFGDEVQDGLTRLGQEAEAAASTVTNGGLGNAVRELGRGTLDVARELLGVRPAASQPSQTVNFANIEKTPDTVEFIGSVPNASGRFLEFADNTTAGRALLRDLENKISDRQKVGTTPTLNNIVPEYSPASDSNNPAQHANSIATIAARDVPGFTADTPLSIDDLRGPTGVALLKGFAKAEEGMNLTTAEASKGVAAYTAVPSVPTTLIDGVYAPTSAADLAKLDAIRNGSAVAVAEVAPRQTTAPAPQVVQDVVKIAATAAELSPTIIAARTAFRLVDRLLNQPARQPAPAAQVPANTVATPAVLTPAPTTAVAPGTPVTNVRQDLITTEYDTKGVDTRLVHIFEEAARQFPLRVELFSGKGHRDGTHGRGLAGDVMIYDTAGNPIAAYMVPETANIYALFAERARKVQMDLYPELNNKFVWGGAFTGMVKSPGGTAKYGGGDFMDFRIGGKINTNQMQAYKFGEGWQKGFEYYTAGDVLGIGARAISEADYAKLEGFQLSPAQIASQIEKSTKGARQTKTKSGKFTQKVTQFHAGLLGHKNIGPQQTITTEVAPVVASPATQPETVTPTQVSTPNTAVQPATVAPSTVAQPGTPSLSSTQASSLPTPAVTSPAIPSPSSPANRPPGNEAIPGDNVTTPPNNLGNVGPGRAGDSLNAVERAGLAVYGAIAGIIAVMASVLGDDDSESDTDEEVAVEEDGILTEQTASPDENNPPSEGPVSPTTGNPANQNTNNSNQPGIIDPNIGESMSTSSKPTVNVLIQVDGNTGDTYFDVEGVYINDTYKNYNYIHEEEDPDEIDTEYKEPSIILDDQHQNVIYSDGTYAPIVVDGVWYESVDDPRYVYTVEYYEDGELVEVADNADVLPQGNPLSNLLNSLFTDTNSYQLSDVSAITRALIDPDSEIPTDEYYVYRIYLTNGEVRGTTVPEFTSYRYMNERFVETGFVGNVLELIAGSVEIPPPSTGRVVSKIVETLKNVGLSALDLFRNNDDDNNPIVTDFGTIVPSDDGEITMNDIQSVLVLLDVEAECPFVPGLTRPYLYEIVIARGAISNATSDQAFRAVRCGGGDKQDFVDQISNHFETFDGVGTLDRQQLSEMIRFSAFQDLDMSSLVAETSEETVATSTAATVPETPATTAEGTSFKPNVTNEITFEVKAVSEQGQTLVDWTSNTSVSVSSGSQLYFRWDGTAYQQCLPFLNDNGNYSLTVRNRAMTTGDTESEGYNISERSAVYRIECGGQRNNEFGVDDRSIEVTVE